MRVRALVRRMSTRLEHPIHRFHGCGTNAGCLLDMIIQIQRCAAGMAYVHKTCMCNQITAKIVGGHTSRIEFVFYIMLHNTLAYINAVTLSSYRFTQSAHFTKP